MVTEPLDRSVLSYVHHQIIILNEKTDAATAVKLMHDRKAETIIVQNEKGEYVGIITDSDILDKIVMRGEDSDQVSLKTIMSSPIITISAKANVRDALELMRLNNVKRIPVTDNVHILGIVTQEGLAHAIRTSVLEKTFRPYRAVIGNITNLYGETLVLYFNLRVYCLLARLYLQFPLESQKPLLVYFCVLPLCLLLDLF
jgi:trk system potassium uptake protein TrkH